MAEWGQALACITIFAGVGFMWGYQRGWAGCMRHKGERR